MEIRGTKVYLPFLAVSTTAVRATSTALSRAPVATSTGVSAANVTSTTADLVWTPSNAVVTEVGRNGVDSTGGGPWNGVPANGATSQTFLFLLPGTTYLLHAIIGGVTYSVSVTTIGANVPTITSISPNPGPAGPITVFGTGFIAGSTVSIGGVAATGVTIVTTHQITCTAPAHAAGAVSATVTNNAGISAGFTFTYQTPPAGTTVSPVGGDNTANIQNAINALAVNGTLNFVANATYNHSGNIYFNKAGHTINGNNATLNATADLTSAVFIDGTSNVTMRNLNLTAPASGPRYTEFERMKLTVRNCSNITLVDVSVHYSAVSGMMLFNVTNFTVSRCTVDSSRADGIHCTGGTNNGIITDCHTINTGDDGMSIVSYDSDSIACHHITNNGGRVDGTYWGRGITVVGGHDIFINDFQINSTDAGGIYIACEPQFNTYPLSLIRYNNGLISNCNTNPNIGHAPIMLYSDRAGFGITDVDISNVDISNNPATVGRNVALNQGAGTFSDINFINIALHGNLPALQSNVTPGSYTTTGWTRDGTPITVP